MGLNVHKILCTGFSVSRSASMDSLGCPIFIGLSSNLSTSLYSALSVGVLVSSDNPRGVATESISSSRPHQLNGVCISQVVQLLAIAPPAWPVASFRRDLPFARPRRERL